MYLQVAAWQISRNAALLVSTLRRSHPALSQPPRTELADSPGKMPFVPAADITALPCNRTPHGLALSRLLHPFWLDAGDIEVPCARLPAAGVGLYRRGNQAASGRDDSAWAGPRDRVQSRGSGK